MHTQPTPWNLSGTFAERPSATGPGMEQGYLFYAEDLDVAFMLVENPVTHVRGWRSMGAGGIAADQSISDGSAGDVVITAPMSPYVLPADFYPNSLTVQAGVIVNLASGEYVIRAKTRIDILAGATVRANGNPGVGLVGGAGTIAGTLHGSGSGGNGVKNGVGTIGASDPLTCMPAPVGGNGGAGGAGGVNAGGLGGSPITSSTAGALHRFDTKLRAQDLGGIAGGSGGGGGGSDNILATPGGGGGGAGEVWLVAPTIVNAGTIEAIGGAGAAAVAAAGAAGGGGGGGGGVVGLIGNDITPGTINVAGGAGGAGAGGGAAGVAGGAGVIQIG
jgi:hypothetical protein